MFSSFFIAAGVVIVTSLVLNYLNRSVTQEVLTNEDGRFYLTMHSSYKIAGYASIFLGLAITIGIFFVDASELFAIAGILGMFLLFTIAGILSVLYYKRHYISFDEKSVEVKSIQNVIERFEWTNIKEGKLNKVSGAIVFKTLDGRKFKVHQHLKGINHFFDMLKQKTGIVVDLSYN